MARVYLKPGDQIETLCTLTCGKNGEFHQPEILDSTELRYFREDESHVDGGEWFQARYDFFGSRETNPEWGKLYYDEDVPGY